MESKGYQIFTFIMCCMCLGFGVFLGYMNGNKQIKSEEIIKPKIELIINNNKVDTLYIYENY